MTDQKAMQETPSPQVEREKAYGVALANATVQTQNKTTTVTLDKGLPRRNRVVVETDEAEAASYIIDNVAKDMFNQLTSAFNFMKQ